MNQSELDEKRKSFFPELSCDLSDIEIPDAHKIKKYMVDIPQEQPDAATIKLFQGFKVEFLEILFPNIDLGRRIIDFNFYPRTDGPAHLAYSIFLKYLFDKNYQVQQTFLKKISENNFHIFIRIIS